VDTVEKVDEVPQKTVFVVQATTSQVSLGSALPQEKVKLAYRLLGVSSQITRVLIFIRSSRMYLIFLIFWQEVLDQGSSQPRTTQS